MDIMFTGGGCTLAEQEMIAKFVLKHFRQTESKDMSSEVAKVVVVQ